VLKACEINLFESFKMKKVILIFLAFSITLFPAQDSFSKVKKLKKNPPIKKILKEKDFGLVVISLFSNMHNYRISFSPYDPGTRKIILDKNSYRVTGPKNLFKGKNLKPEPEPTDFFFLMEKGTYFFRTVRQKYNLTTNSLCFYNSLSFEVKPGQINYLGDISMEFNRAPPTDVSITVKNIEAEKGEVLVQEVYPNLDLPFEISEASFMLYPGKCVGVRSKTNVIVYP